MIAENVRLLRQRIARSCEKSGRSPEDVKLICVTKTASIGDIEEVLKSEIRFLGENRVQDALAKYVAIGNRAEWHLIGHLQTNKAKDAVGMFSLIHSVDSVRLAGAIDKEAAKSGKVQDILIQVNTSGEESKFGMPPGTAENFIKEISIYPNIDIKGFMTIAPEAADPETVRPYFRALRELRDRLNAKRSTLNALQVLSMGMTNDFEIAIEEGSTMVRIGRAIFAKAQCQISKDQF
ncbi:MAG: YggS family pyridoxal phosphate-dependent enzyme [Candidatus Omnitrophica bacterium]|nr:YggS family pyridoxal phosphate-dependent enzyme [Candidatus Omnitrophota bacterium]MDD5436399.1 YggS family pyridoxal phosphate-dependent enzyme [Candidatus Omnitrophota bacterium]